MKINYTCLANELTPVYYKVFILKLACVPVYLSLRKQSCLP